MTKKIVIEEINGDIRFENVGFNKMEVIGILQTQIVYQVSQTQPKPIITDSKKNTE